MQTPVGKMPRYRGVQRRAATCSSVQRVAYARQTKETEAILPRSDQHRASRGNKYRPSLRTLKLPVFGNRKRKKSEHLCYDDNVGNYRSFLTHSHLSENMMSLQKKIYTHFETERNKEREDMSFPAGTPTAHR